MKRLLIASALLAVSELLLADPVIQVARTQENTLNDLVRELPVLSLSREKELRKLSAIQELLYLHELRMRGEGLPLELASVFSTNYSAIITALVEDGITEDYGRELLSIHRQILNRTHLWLTKRTRDENFPVEVMENLGFYLGELHRNAIPLREVPPTLRTPVINGYQVWVGELLAWGCECGTLSSGDLSKIKVKADELERFEGYYKRDGVIQPYERELLHGRFLKLTRETIKVLAR